MNVEQQLLVLALTKGMAVVALKRYAYLSMRLWNTPPESAEYAQVFELATVAGKYCREANDTLLEREDEPAPLTLEWTN